MTDKFHILKTWDGKDYSKIKEKKYIAVDAIIDWLDENYLKFNTMKDVIDFKRFLED